MPPLQSWARAATKGSVGFLVIMKGRNIVLALALSVMLTLALALLYIFWSTDSGVYWMLHESSGTGGISAVAGGVSNNFLMGMLVLELFLFLIILGLLQTKHARR